MNPTAETGTQIEDRELSEDELAKNSAKLVAKLNQVLPKISGFNEALYKSFLSGGRAVTFEGGGSRFTVARIVDP